MNEAIQNLKDDLAAAGARHKALVDESKAMPTKLQEASRQVAVERAQSARQGQAGSELLAVASEADVEELRRREQALPLEIWGQQLVLAEISRDLVAAELEEAEMDSIRTGSAFDTAQARLAEAEKERDAAYAAHSSAGARINQLKQQLKRSNTTVTELENGAPGV